MAVIRCSELTKLPTGSRKVMGMFAKKGRTRMVELKDDPVPVIQWYKDYEKGEPSGFLELVGASLYREGEILIVTPALGTAELVLSDFQPGECELWEESMLALASTISRSRLEAANAQTEATEAKAAAAAAVIEATTHAETLVSEQKEIAEKAVLAAGLDASRAIEAAEAKAVAAQKEAQAAENQRRRALAELEEKQRQKKAAKPAEQVIVVGSDRLFAAETARDAAEERARALQTELETCRAECKHLKLQLLIERDRAELEACKGHVSSDLAVTSAADDGTLGGSVDATSTLGGSDIQSPLSKTHCSLNEESRRPADDDDVDILQLWLSAPASSAIA